MPCVWNTPTTPLLRVLESPESPPFGWRQWICPTKQVDTSDRFPVTVMDSAGHDNCTLALADSTKSAHLEASQAVNLHAQESQRGFIESWKGHLEGSVPRTLKDSQSRLSLGGDWGNNASRFQAVSTPVAATHGIQNTTLEPGPAHPPVVSVTCHRPQPTQAASGSKHLTTFSGRNKPAGRASLTRGNGSLQQNNKGGRYGQGNDEPKGDDEGDQDRDEVKKEAKRARAPQEGPFGCPYRKRNTLRFNIRDHIKCTKGFKDFSVLKSASQRNPNRSSR